MMKRLAVKRNGNWHSKMCFRLGTRVCNNMVLYVRMGMTAVPFSPSVLHICPHSTDRTEKVATLPGTLYTKMTFPFGLPFFI